MVGLTPRTCVYHTLPAREFGRDARAPPDSDEIARRASTGEPVRGRRR